MEGLPAQCASILSEFVEEEMDFTGIGRLLAVTPNQEVNTLAVREMAHVFGRRNVYQIAPDGGGSERRRSVGESMRGRVLFQNRLGPAQLTEKLLEGWTIKKTTLGQAYTYDDFQARYGRDAVVLFLIDPQLKVHVASADETLSPKAGDTLVVLVPAEVRRTSTG